MATQHERAGGMQAPLLGNYELIRRLGEGGMAQVYLARDVRLGREVAVKVLDKELAHSSGFRDRFDREAKVAARLDHPNIVPLYDYGENGGVLYLVMPYLSGGSVQQMLKRAPFPADQALTYGAQICDALAYAHKEGVIHRDVKPANMLLHADGRVMLADFGLAKILDGSSRAGRRSGRPDAGTPEYMAPEQIRGHSEPRSDLYGLGVVLYLLLTGRLPFSGPTSEAVMDAHLYGHPAPLRSLNPHVTPAVEAVVLRALAKRPEDRFASASDMGAALMQALVAGEAEPLPFSSDPSGATPFSHPSRLPDISGLPSGLPQSQAPYSPGNSYQSGAQSGAGGTSATSLLPSLDVPEAASHLSGQYSGAAFGAHGPLPTNGPTDRAGGAEPFADAFQGYAARLPHDAPFGGDGYPREHLPTRPLSGSGLSTSAPSQTALVEPRASLTMPSPVSPAAHSAMGSWANGYCLSAMGQASPLGRGLPPGILLSRRRIRQPA